MRTHKPAPITIHSKPHRITTALSAVNRRLAELAPLYFRLAASIESNGPQEFTAEEAAALVERPALLTEQNRLISLCRQKGIDPPMHTPPKFSPPDAGGYPTISGTQVNTLHGTARLQASAARRAITALFDLLDARLDANADSDDALSLAFDTFDDEARAALDTLTRNFSRAYSANQE